ncbi:MAG TPA: hypothetical protein VGB85_15680, partial [Nannocystis sp.]
QLLAGADLDPTEIKGAVLGPWPAARGYVKTATGRPLAAFDTDDLGRVRTFIDEAVYREQFAQLVPRAVEASRSLIDWVWPSWPELLYDAAAGNLDLEIAAELQSPELLVFTQTAEGLRTIKQKVRLKPGVRNRVANLPKLQADERTVVVLRARRATGEPLLLEQALGAESKTFGVVPAAYVPPPPPPPPAELETSEPEPAAAPEASPEGEPVDPATTPAPGTAEDPTKPAATPKSSDPAGKASGTGATTKPATGTQPTGTSTKPATATQPTGTSTKPATGTQPTTSAQPTGSATRPAASTASKPAASQPDK